MDYLLLAIGIYYAQNDISVNKQLKQINKTKQTMSKKENLEHQSI